jgi:signal transduction histidine kinase
LDDIERRRLAELLHDDVLQYFAACQMRMQLCRRYLNAGRIDEAGQELTVMEKAVDEAIAGVRQVIATINHPRLK